LINASPVGTGEKLLDGLSNDKKRKKEGEIVDSTSPHVVGIFLHLS
jgi:hypothetical protein